MAIDRHKVTIAGKVSSIRLPDYYDGQSEDGTSSNIGSVVGINKMGETEDYPPGTLPITVGNGLQVGVLARLVIRHKGTSGTEAEKRSRSSRIVCAGDKAFAAVSGLIGKTYRGRKITSVSIPQRQRLS